MPTIGVDSEVIIDGTGYFIKPGSYTMKNPRVRTAQYRADGTLSYVDIGPSRRTWEMVILAVNELFKYDGTKVSNSGEQYRDALRTSFAKTAQTINFTDPLSGSSIPVYFDSYTERIVDLHSQIIALSTGGSAGASYEITIVLLEA